MKKIILFIAFCIVFVSAKAQDTIWLKSGQTITGYILSFTNGFRESSTVTIQLKTDTAVYKMNEIKSISYNGGTAGAEKSKNLFPVYDEDRGNKKHKRERAAKSPVKTEQ